MRIVAHDENSLTNLLFSEIHRHEKIVEFLRAIQWRSHSKSPFEITKAVLHQQLNLSEFGKPDVTIVVTDTERKKHIVIVEAKLDSYVRSCGYNLKNGKFNNRNNSKLNNQITLRYRAFRSVLTISKEGYMTETTHTPESLYSEDSVRRCKKPETCRILGDIAKEGFQFYLVVLTSDREPPFNTVEPSHRCFPLFYNQKTESLEDFLNLGSVNWNICNRLFHGLQNHFTESYEKLVTEISGTNVPPDPGALFVRGRKIIKFRGKVCLLTCRGYSYAIRHFCDGKCIELDRGKQERDKYLYLREQIEVLARAPSIPYQDTSSWGKYFQQNEF